MTIGLLNINHQGKLFRFFSIVGAFIGATLVVSGLYLPWVRSQSAPVGHGEFYVSRSLTLSDLGSGSWQWKISVFTLCALAASFFCQKYRLARWVLLLAGMATAVSVLGVYKNHGYALRFAGIGPILSFCGGAIFVILATLSFLLIEVTNQDHDRLRQKNNRV